MVTLPEPSFAPTFKGRFKALGDACFALANNAAKARQMGALMSLSDQELAAKSLKREDIPRHVFGDGIFILVFSGCTHDRPQPHFAPLSQSWASNASCASCAEL